MDFTIRLRLAGIPGGKILSGDLALRNARSLLVGTSNEGKLREVHQLLNDLPFALLDLSDVSGIESVPETGQTFVENASLKAIGYATQTRLLTLADDSGLEVDALGGAPGVFSARYLDESASFPERIAYLLAELEKVEAEKRTARFVSAIAIADAEGSILNISLGTCEGHIAFAPRGSRGFGYDPVFIPAGYDLTFGELDSRIKNQISHRARSLQSARDYLLNLTRL